MEMENRFLNSSLEEIVNNFFSKFENVSDILYYHFF